MVCLGNICRSPMAEGILRAKVASEKIIVDSAGTGNYHIGDPPDPRSIKIGEKYGIDISHLRGRQFTVADFDTFDIIYVMDESNYQHVVKLSRSDTDIRKVKFILDEIYPNQNYNVPDPYHGNLHQFDAMYKMLDEACEAIASKLS
ncbi:MAG TPA: low molecular weight protein-tyrosine-phosphatase [Flavobacteriaceae bacterium]|nr:low molecular weight protein-tyrosine-phosphatase [Flavobacteriaceae bacterium]